MSEPAVDPGIVAYYAWLTDPGRTEYLQLVQDEEDFMIPKEIYSKSSFRRSRGYALRYFEENARGFEVLIPYLAMTYYDRLHGEYEEPSQEEDELQEMVVDYKKKSHLFLICCLTIAWKMRTRRFNLKIFMQKRELKYPIDDVIAMEHHICHRLKWRLRTVTPFCFIEYLIPILAGPPSVPSPRRPVRQLITKAMCDADFLEYRPSILAAAAMLTIASRRYRERHIFEFQVRTAEFVAPHVDMVLKCKKQLDSLYVQIEFIPIPHTPRLRSNPRSFPCVAQQQQERRPGKEPTSSGEIRLADQPQGQHQGKEPTYPSSEIPIAERRGAEVIDMDDLAMNFEPGWTQALEAAGNRLDRDSLSLDGVMGRILQNCCSTGRQGWTQELEAAGNRLDRDGLSFDGVIGRILQNCCSTGRLRDGCHLM